MAIQNANSEWLESRVSELTQLVESVASANATAAELMAELEDTRSTLQHRNQELENRQMALLQALEQARSADASSDAKSRFLANISHEMRTPLNAMIGLSYLLQDTPLNTEQTPYVNNIRNSAETLLALINDLLDVSKIEAGELILEEVEFNPASLVEGIAVLVAPQAHAKSLDLVVKPILDMPSIVIGDPGRLRQILLNLLSNAVKFTHQGQIVIAARQTLETDDSATIRFSVADSGIGISAVDQERLFRPFSQVDSSPSRNFGGTGIGLAIASQLVSRMNGEIGVESSPGSGSTFWFSVRLGKQYRIDHDSARWRLQNTPILIVDDSLAVRRAISGYVRNWGAIPAEAGAIADAHELLAKPFDSEKSGIMIVDEDMPGVHSLLRTATRPGSRWHPVILQATGSPAVNDCREFGLPTLAKPVRAAALLRSLMDATAKPLCTSLRLPPLALVKGNILLVEDNLVNRTVSSSILKKLGITVHEAANGVAGLEAAMKFQFDLILMDCQMPVMDGYEATRKLRLFEAGRTRTPVVAVTANAMDGDREKCLAAGMDEYTTKPITPSGLRDLVVRWMRKPVPTR
ncbi:MAG: response regulator [Bryobacterales bacterium]|nr:response regulator [Bryobacterales bacterium]